MSPHEPHPNRPNSPAETGVDRHAEAALAEVAITPIQAAEFQFALADKARRDLSLPTEKRLAAQTKAREMMGVLEILDYSAESGNSVDTLVKSTEHGIGTLDIDTLRRAQEFSSHDYSFLAESSQFKHWQRDRQAKAIEKANADKESAAVVESDRKAMAVDGSRAELAKTYLIQNVLKGGIAAHTDFAAKYSQRGYQGFSERSEEKRHGIPLTDYNVPFALEDKNLDRTYGDKGIHEGVLFSPIKKNIYKEVDVPGRKKRFGHEPATKQRRVVGTKPVLASEVVDGAPGEPAVEMIYRTFGDTGYSQETEYKVSDGRTGNILVVSVIMPESVAKEFEQACKAEPHLLRMVVEKAMIENLNIPEDVWRKGDEHTRGNPMRPPYEAWAKASGGQSKIYFQEPGSKVFDPSRVVAVKPA